MLCNLTLDGKDGKWKMKILVNLFGCVPSWKEKQMDETARDLQAYKILS